MSRLQAALGSGLFFAVAPGIVAGAIPYAITGWTGDAPLALQVAGGVLLAVSVPFLVHAFARFVREGVGTPAPVAPTEHLVVGGVYRYVRNPMYLAVMGAILGQAALFGSAALVVWGVTAGATMVAFARGYEEPALAQQFGAEYERYRETVPGWWPRRIEKT